MSNADIAIWTSVAAGAAAIFASAISSLATYFVTERGVEAAKSTSADERTHEVQQAWTDREQNRKLDAYLALARHVGNWTRQISWEMDRAVFDTDPPTPPPIGDVIDYTSEALISLVGSQVVWDAVKTFNVNVKKYLLTSGMARKMQTYATPLDRGSTGAANLQLDKAEKAGRIAIESGKSLMDLMRLELLPPGQST